MVRPDDVGSRMSCEADGALISGRKRTSAQDRRRVHRTNLALELLEPRWLLASAADLKDSLESARRVLEDLTYSAQLVPVDIAQFTPNPPVGERKGFQDSGAATPPGDPLPPYQIVVDDPAPHATPATAQRLPYVSFLGIVGTLRPNEPIGRVCDLDRPADAVAPVHPEVGSSGFVEHSAAPALRFSGPTAGRRVAGDRPARHDLELWRDRPAAGLGTLPGDRPAGDVRPPLGRADGLPGLGLPPHDVRGLGRDLRGSPRGIVALRAVASVSRRGPARFDPPSRGRERETRGIRDDRFGGGRDPRLGSWPPDPSPRSPPPRREECWTNAGRTSRSTSSWSPRPASTTPPNPRLGRATPGRATSWNPPSRGRSMTGRRWSPGTVPAATPCSARPRPATGAGAGRCFRPGGPRRNRSRSSTLGSFRPGHRRRGHVRRRATESRAAPKAPPAPIRTGRSMAVALAVGFLFADPAAVFHSVVSLRGPAASRSPGASRRDEGALRSR